MFFDNLVFKDLFIFKNNSFMYFSKKLIVGWAHFGDSDNMVRLFYVVALVKICLRV